MIESDDPSHTDSLQRKRMTSAREKDTPPELTNAEKENYQRFLKEAQEEVNPSGSRMPTNIALQLQSEEAGPLLRGYILRVYKGPRRNETLIIRDWAKEIGKHPKMVNAWILGTRVIPFDEVIGSLDLDPAQATHFRLAIEKSKPVIERWRELLDDARTTKHLENVERVLASKKGGVRRGKE